MEINNKILQLRKFIVRILKSDASTLIFYSKLVQDSSKYIIIQKHREFSRLPTFKRRINIQIIDEEHQNIEYDISHFYDPTKHEQSIAKRFISRQRFKMENDIDLNCGDSNDTEKELCSIIKIDDLDFTNYYKLINVIDFKQKFKDHFVNKENDNNRWNYEELYGLFKKQKKFVQKHSDYGYDNLYTIIFANSKFINTKKKKFEINLDPAGTSQTFFKHTDFKA